MSQTAVKEITKKDEVGRIVCIQYKDFWAYVERKKMTKADLLKMKSDKREDFFIKWKHGMDDINTNWEFEYSLRSFLKNFKDIDLSDIDPYFKESVKIRREFDSYCESIKQQIGLWTGKKEVPPEVQKILDSVGGTMVAELVPRE